ncbi:hypothetical protein BJF82_03020 [Kytococcus sp. CUA-901]|nr:hypothetical protein BJF82_03020 [Kytococcus sp. CUA-901]
MGTGHLGAHQCCQLGGPRRAGPGVDAVLPGCAVLPGVRAGRRQQLTAGQRHLVTQVQRWLPGRPRPLLGAVGQRLHQVQQR